MDILRPEYDKYTEELQVLWDKEPGFYSDLQEILVDKGTDIYLEAEGIQEIQERISRIKVVCDSLLASELMRFEEEEVEKIRKNFKQMFSAYERYLMAMTP